MQLLPRAMCDCWSINKRPRTFLETKTVIVCKRSTFSSHDALPAMRREWDRQELAGIAKTCLMMSPGVCHCWHCVPPVPAHDVQLPRHRVHYCHVCHVCLDKFRCIPAIPPCRSMPPSRNVACRCLTTGTRNPLMPSYESFFCSNLCFWEIRSKYEY